MTKPSKTKVDQETTITIKYKNEGGDASTAFISPSFSSDAEVASASGDLSLDGIYKPGDWIWNSNGNQMKAKSTLVDFKGSFSSDSTKTFTIKIKPTQEGTTWFKVRAAMKRDGNYQRDPTSGTTDQQGWYAREYSITVERNTYTVTAKTTEASTKIKIGNTVMCTTQWSWWAWDNVCDFTTTGAQKVTAEKEGFVSDPPEISVFGSKEIKFTMNPASYTSAVSTNVQNADIFLGSSWKCNTGQNKQCSVTGLTATNTLTAKKVGYEEKQAQVSYSNKDASINLDQLFIISSVTPSSSTPTRGQLFTVYTKVNKVYMKDIGWGNKEAKVKVTLSFNDVSAKAYEDTFTNNCNIITCTLLGGWHLITNGWELSQVFSINSIGDKSISVFAEDLYAGTSDSKNTQITVKEPPKPKPVLVSLDYQSEMPENGEETIIVKYRNDGGDSYEAYFSPSFDNNWEVKEYTGDLANKKLYPKDSEISTSKNTGTKPSDYPLIDFWGEWKSGQEKTFKIKLKPKSTGPIFFNLRVALCYFDVERKCIRDPTSGETDQQGWDVYRKTVKVNPVLHKLELSSNENSVMFSTNKGESCIAYGNSCEIELSSGDYTITAQKVAKSTLPWEKLIMVNAPKIEANVPPERPSRPSTMPPDQQPSITRTNNGIYQKPIETGPTRGMLITSHPNFE